MTAAGADPARRRSRGGEMLVERSLIARIRAWRGRGAMALRLAAGRCLGPTARRRSRAASKPASGRALPPDAAPLGPHGARQVHRLSRNFIEPPLGSYISEQFTMQVAKADPHRFMLYKTDFLPGTDSVLAHRRLAVQPDVLAACRAGSGPITVEWTPDEPGLAESRRQAVLATLQRAGRPIVAERVVDRPVHLPRPMAVLRPPTITTTLSPATSSLPRTTRSRPAAAAYGGVQ